MLRCPLWIQSWMEVFLTLPYGEWWTELIHNWIQLEHDYGYISPVHAHPSLLNYHYSHSCVQPWWFTGWIVIVQALAKAKFNSNFTCDPPVSIVSNFCSWWVNLNSPTHSILDNGSLSQGAEDGAIKVNKLHVLGKNGWLSMLFALMVWRKFVGNGDTAEWDETIFDINRVTLHLINLVHT